MATNLGKATNCPNIIVELFKLVTWLRMNITPLRIMITLAELNVEVAIEYYNTPPG
jgi:hypothetical protein